ncbi:hypothetical protein BGW80DRAFT_1465522 [Lactifluus volemus]|nr:hypothetical protein BGW80DRAFT_1465522 [Lactifluus volemus]
MFCDVLLSLHRGNIRHGAVLRRQLFLCRRVSSLPVLIIKLKPTIYVSHRSYHCWPTHHADFELNKVLVIFQNAQFDPTWTIGWHLEAEIIIDKRYSKVHDVLVNFCQIPNDSESLRLRARAALGTKHRWDTLPSMSSFCLEGVLDLVPKQGPKASGIRLSTLSQISIHLLAISSQELGLKARQKMDYRFGVFGTIHIAVSSSSVPMAERIWLSNVLFSTMFDARAVARSYQFDLSVVLEWESTIIELSGHYRAGGDYSLTAIVEKHTSSKSIPT